MLLRATVLCLILPAGCALNRAPLTNDPTDAGLDVPSGLDAPFVLPDVPGLDVPEGFDTPLPDVPGAMMDTPAILPDVPAPPDTPAEIRDVPPPPPDVPRDTPAPMPDVPRTGDGVPCGMATCTSPNVCCVDFGSGASSCTPAGACRASAFECDGPEDCPGELCCATGDATSASSTCGASCIVRVCHVAGDCPSGNLCCPVIGGSGYCSPVCR